MGKIRVYDLAKEMGVAPKELADRIKQMGYSIRTHSSTISESEAREIRVRLEAEGWGKKEGLSENKEEKKTVSQHTVIVRRSKETSQEKEDTLEEEREDIQPTPEEATPKAKVKPKIKLKLKIKKPLKGKTEKETKKEPPKEEIKEVSSAKTVEEVAEKGEKKVVAPSVPEIKARIVEKKVLKPKEEQKEKEVRKEKEAPPVEEIKEPEARAEEKPPKEAKVGVEKEPSQEVSAPSEKKEARVTKPSSGPKVVARAVGMVKTPLQRERDKKEGESRIKKHKKERRVVTDFAKRSKPKAPAPSPTSMEKPGDKKPKRSRKKQVVEMEDFLKKKAKKKVGRPKAEREEIMEELELMKELESVEGMELPEVTEEKKPGPKGETEKKVSEEQEPKASTLPRREKKIKVYESIQVGELAKLMGVKASDIIRKFMEMGTMVTINQSIDPDTAAIIAAEFGFEVEQAPIEEEQLLEYKPPAPEELEPRSPVVTVMGHVDHGKTTLLDAVRQTDVALREAGGITQHIGAYKVRLENGQEITFIDTPGHEAFTSMRARGAQVTDIVILVVAADDGVMDQTREAIDHAKAAGVPVVVAINKIDKPDANPERVKTELAELGLVPEEWGGETLYVEISAKKKIGIRELLDLVLLQAEMLELKAAPNRPARGRIIESRLDKGRGPVATVIIQEGTLHEGDPFVAGVTHGRVRAMLDEHGRRLKEAGPSTPVEILGFSEVPQAGDDFIVMPDEQKARKVAEYRARKQREAEMAREAKMSLEQLFDRLREGEIKELKVILKADVQGTLEALADSLRKLATEEVRVNIIRTGIGAISESDVMLASASKAIIIGFNVRPTPKAKQLAQQEKVEIRFYDVIYKVIEDIKKAMSGLLEPEYEEKIMGLAEVRATFKVPKVGVVAGCYVKEGRIERGARVRLLRDNVVVYNGRISSLKRFKEDVKEVHAGYECGVGLENFNDIKVGDHIEAYEIIEIKREL